MRTDMTFLPEFGADKSCFVLDQTVGSPLIRWIHNEFMYVRFVGIIQRFGEIQRLGASLISFMSCTKIFKLDGEKSVWKGYLGWLVLINMYYPDTRGLFSKP